MNKKQLMIIVLILLVFISGCGSYDEGYDDGYDGAIPSFLNKLSTSYNEGYEDGVGDAYYFNLGYNDAQNDERPRYPDVEIYMEGYREGE